MRPVFADDATDQQGRNYRETDGIAGPESEYMAIQIILTDTEYAVHFGLGENRTDEGHPQVAQGYQESREQDEFGRYSIWAMPLAE